jgi:purine-binding chemotaxis protein CheW
MPPPDPMSAARASRHDEPSDWSGSEGTADEPKTYVTFELSAQGFAIDVENVREILDVQPVSRLPNAPGDVLGLIDIRGEKIAVVDLAGRLGMATENCAADSRIIVFELSAGNASPTAIGVIADRVLSVVEITDAAIEATPKTLTSWDDSAMRGVTRIAGALTMVLDLAAVFRLEAADTQDPFDFSEHASDARAGEQESGRSTCLSLT